MDRRKHPRLIGPFDGRWRGASGGGLCRIGDISLGGCFVNAMSTPTVGERTSVSIEIDGEEFPLPMGAVITSEWGFGFGVAFKALNQAELDDLKNLMGRLRQQRKSA
jgi:hypothetical protein